MNIEPLMFRAGGSMIALAALLAILMATEPQRMHAGRETARGRAITQGAMLYADHCRSCHGIRGEGVGQLGPPLADRSFFTTRLTEVGWLSSHEAYILATTEHGRLIGTRPFYAGNGETTVMPAWDARYGGPLRPDQIQALTAFILNWEATALGRIELAPLDLPADNPGDPAVIARGREVFSRDCAGCHTYRQTATSAAGPDLSDIAARPIAGSDPSDRASHIRESVMIPEARIDSAYAEAAATRPCGAILTVTELHDVIAFLLQ